VGQSLIEGIILTSIVMLLFLHAWRNSIVVLVSIPTSILATFIVMHALNFHIDTMSMMGLSLIIGILVDDSIVVLENITRHRDLGEDPMNAAINGRTEIGNAAIAITMVDVVVFLPVAFLPGIVGAYLKEFGAVDRHRDAVLAARVLHADAAPGREVERQATLRSRTEVAARAG
jgi:HAE1 family hydrophobic/amphiphilic exporter-1